jgi:hypothetical protein
MSKGLKKWFNEKWVDIGAKKKNGSYQECGRKSASSSERKYPKCVPLAKATQMTKSEKASAVKRKRSVPNTGPKPMNVKTKIKKMQSGALTVTPQVSTEQFSDDFSTTSIQRGGVEIGKEFDFGRGVINPYIQKETTESEFYPTQKMTRKGITGSFESDIGKFEGSYSDTPMGKDYRIGFSKTFRFNKGGMNKYSTINQEDTYVGTGGFADSNYQQQVKKLLEE